MQEMNLTYVRTTTTTFDSKTLRLKDMFTALYNQTGRCEASPVSHLFPTCMLGCTEEGRVSYLPAELSEADVQLVPPARRLLIAAVVI